MADKNNFKELNSDYEDQFSLPRMEAIARNLKNKKDDALATSGIFDLFVPKAIKTLARLLGGEKEQNPDAPPNMGGGGSSRSSESKGPGER